MYREPIPHASVELPCRRSAYRTAYTGIVAPVGACSCAPVRDVTMHNHGKQGPGSSVTMTHVHVNLILLKLYLFHVYVPRNRCHEQWYRRRFRIASRSCKDLV